jgi:CRP-like cAMP-binding protein
MANMKSAEKLAFLDKCEVQALAFNSFAYRRGEDVDALYYLLEGQVKMLKELGENVYEVASLERGRMFGLFELRSRISQRELYAKASANSTNVLQIPLKLIEKVCSDR